MVGCCKEMSSVHIWIISCNPPLCLLSPSCFLDLCAGEEEELCVYNEAKQADGFSAECCEEDRIAKGYE